MSAVEVRAFVPDDLIAIMPASRAVAFPPGWSIHGLTVTMAGKPVAVGGLVRIGPHWWTFAEITGPARKPMLVHRLVMNGLRAADECGIRRIYGYCDDAYPRARAWIERMGFRPMRGPEKDAAIRDVETWVSATAWVREGASGH